MLSLGLTLIILGISVILVLCTEKVDKCLEGLTHDYECVKIFSTTVKNIDFGTENYYVCELWECRNCGHKTITGYYNKLTKNQKDKIDLWLENKVRF